ncbi:MAG: bifunctional glutamate N-acetyltransferase/amino-acid acetyltransferase ArgJ [Pseudomonadota bacterium]|nr:bifunctional glutamate N-acetyltransferase/amino-acid acetyltransferase ArgJ [Pseudomonadota bacterium]
MQKDSHIKKFKSFPKLPKINGFRLSSCNANIRYEGRHDLMLAEFISGTSVGGIMTSSQVIGAPVKWNKKIISHGKARALVVNSGIANVFTGKDGDLAVLRTANKVSEELNCNLDEVFIASTGTIGEYLDDSKITNKIGWLLSNLKKDNWENAANSILTTDTFPKGTSQSCQIDGTDVQIAGIAKGSGMIAPDMATMLAFIITDANLSSNLIQELIKNGNEKSFGCITVDSDTSTSDTLLMFSTNQANHERVFDINDPRLKDFALALDQVLIDLAKKIVIDGEGAKKFIQINTRGAVSNSSAKKIGLSIANSPLVKTALAGEDANWGRVVMAIGKSGEKVDAGQISVSFGSFQLASKGEKVKKIDEVKIAEYLKGEFIEIFVSVGNNDGESTVWTCDLTREYIAINADYRT